MLLAQIPQTARVNKKTLQAPDGRLSGRRRSSSRSRRRPCRARSTPTRTSSRSAISTTCASRACGSWRSARRARGKSPSDVPKEIYEIPVSSPSYNVTYVTVEDDDDEWVTFAAAAGLHRRDGRVGLRGVGHGYYYPPYVGYGGISCLLPVLSDLRLRRRTTTHGPAHTAAAPRHTVRTAARATARGTTRAPAPTRAARRHTGPYGARGAARRPTTRAPARYGADAPGLERLRQLGIDGGPARRSVGADTSRVTNNRTGNTTRVTQGSGGGTAVSRNTPGRGGGCRRPDRQRRRVRRPRRQRLSQAGRQLAEVRQRRLEQRQHADAEPEPRRGHAGQTGTGHGRRRTAQARRHVERRATGDSSTVGQLNRDATARTTGSQRTSDLGSVRSGTTSRSGSYRPSGGGASRGGGGARRGRGTPPPL